MLPVTYSKFVTTEVNVAIILDFKLEVYHPSPLKLKEEILPVTFSLKEPLISYENQTGSKRHKINGRKLKHPEVITA